MTDNTRRFTADPAGNAFRADASTVDADGSVVLTEVLKRGQGGKHQTSLLGGPAPATHARSKQNARVRRELVDLAMEMRALVRGPRRAGFAVDQPVAGGSPGAAFNPLTIAGCLVWYDLRFCTQSGGIVTALPDRSGNGKDGIFTAGFEPLYEAANAGFGNQPVMTFPNGSSLFVQSPDLGITTNPRTFVIVCSTDGANNDICFTDSTSGALFRGTAASFFECGDGGTVLQVGGSGSPSVAVWVNNGASSKLFVSALTPTTGNTITYDLTGSPMILGTYTPLTDPSFAQRGSTAQFLVYDSALSDAAVAYLLNGLGVQNGIAIGP